MRRFSIKASKLHSIRTKVVISEDKHSTQKFAKFLILSSFVATNENGILTFIVDLVFDLLFDLHYNFCEENANAGDDSRRNRP